MSELKAELAAAHINAKGSKTKIVEVATAAGIELKKTYLPGWMGQPKGMLQIFFSVAS